MCYSLWCNAPTMLPATGRQHRGCISLAQNVSEGKTVIEDEQRSERTSTTRRGDNTARVRELVRSDRRLTVKIIANELNMNREAVRLILTEELGMRKNCAKMAPRNLTEQQRDARWSTVFDIQMHHGETAASLTPDLAPCDFFLFQKLNFAVKGNHFESTEASRGK